MNDINNIPVNVHIGEKVQKVFEQRGLRLFDFADKLGTVRQNVYRIFKKHHVDTGLLTKISEVLDHNFFQYYCEGNNQDSLHDLRIQKLEEEIRLSKKETEYLKKIITLMEDKAELVQQIEKPASQLYKPFLKKEDQELVA